MKSRNLLKLSQLSSDLLAFECPLPSCHHYYDGVSRHSSPGDKLPQGWWLKTTETDSLTVVGGRIQNQAPAEPGSVQGSSRTPSGLWAQCDSSPGLRLHMAFALSVCVCLSVPHRHSRLDLGPVLVMWGDLTLRSVPYLHLQRPPFSSKVTFRVSGGHRSTHYTLRRQGACLLFTGLLQETRAGPDS